MYSLGIVLFEAVPGVRVAPALERDRSAPLDHLSADPLIQPGLAAVIVRATEITADARYDSADQLAQALSAAFASATGRLEPAAGTGPVLMPAELEPTRPSSSALSIELQPSGARPPSPMPLAQRLTHERRQRRRLVGAVIGVAAIVSLLAIVGFPVPNDVEEFITLLQDRATVAGDKADDLARQLDAFVVRRATGDGAR